MITRIILPLILLTIGYGTILLGLVLLLRKLGVPSRWVILLAFLIFGTVTGLLTAWVWPIDSSVYLNVWASLLGDLIYSRSGAWLEKIWPLQVPQVYLLSSLVLYGTLGIFLQGLVTRKKNRRARQYNSTTAGEKTGGRECTL
jgi:hypothetical protein